MRRFVGGEGRHLCPLEVLRMRALLPAELVVTLGVLGAGQHEEKARQVVRPGREGPLSRGWCGWLALNAP